MEDSFSGIVAFSFMAALLLIGAAIRARIKIVRQSLIPASLTAGILGLILIEAGFSFGLSSGDFILFAFHFFTLSFMSLCLTRGKTGNQAEESVVKGGTWLALIWTMSLALQALIGLLVIVIYNHFSGNQLSEFLGLLATHGFTQGPGQVMANATIWQNTFNIENAVSIGLIYASFGFVAAFVFGVPIARWYLKKNASDNGAAEIDDELLKGYYNPETDISTGRHITNSANIDTLSFHIAILGLAYLVTDGFLDLVQPFVENADPFGIRISVLFSHNLFFIWGLIVCVILRAILNRLGWGHFIDDETQKRITSSSVDFMVVGTILSIEFAVLTAFIVPISLVSISVVICTAFLCFGFAKVMENHTVERALTSFGCCCGSTGSGLLLLRIVDPSLQTSISKELAFFNVAILIFSFHIVFVIAPILPNFSLITIIAIYAATFLFSMIGMFLLKAANKKSIR